MSTEFVTDVLAALLRGDNEQLGPAFAALAGHCAALGDSELAVLLGAAALEGPPWPSAVEAHARGAVPERAVRLPAALLVEDDATTALLMAAALEGLVQTTRVSDVAGALERVREGGYQLLLTDVHLPDGDGIDLALQVRALDPALPVMVVSGDATFDRAAEALRAGVREFLAKPVDPERLRGAVTTVLGGPGPSGRRVLAIGAHPDDLELAMGGTLAAHADAQDDVTALVLTDGEHAAAGATRLAETTAGLTLLGARPVFGHLVDTALSEGRPTLDVIERVVAEVAPDIVYVHSLHDTHQDHRAAARATAVAARGVPELLGYQSPSATPDFRPGRFTDVEAQLPRKVAAVAVHVSQSQAWYVAPDLLRATARYWGRHTRTPYAEPFEVLRAR